MLPFADEQAPLKAGVSIRWYRTWRRKATKKMVPEMRRRRGRGFACMFPAGSHYVYAEQHRLGAIGDRP
jgi:hypothetical protein